MPRKAIVLAIVLSLALISQAQITITAPEVPHRVGQQFQYYYQSQDSFLVNIGTPGGPQVWDFTQGDTTYVTTDTYLDPATSPPQYSRANVVIQTDQLNLFGLSEPGILYHWLGPSRFILGAMTTAYQGTPIEFNFQPYINQFPLPLQIGSTWSNNVNLDQIFMISGYEVRLELTSTLNSTADAYGTVQVPLGNFPALRLRNNVSYDLTVSVRILFVWVPILEQQGTSVNYDWRGENVGVLATVNATTPDPGVVYASSMRRLMHTVSTASLADPIMALSTVNPVGFELYGNYPNPFNGETTIAYSLDQATPVDLRIYDLMGRQVAYFHEGAQEVGMHELRWAPDYLAAGLYVVQLRAGSEVQRSTMVYLK